jgi:hypothetical protein|tara:strand:+ start:2231 stop:5002 length:2772 start_codon:yes stop_codon:yes gene_type:complete
MASETYYVDYDGAAGTGDGTSYANRARSIWDVVGNGRGGGMDTQSPVNWNYPSGSNGEEVTIRVKKSPDPTQVATNAKTWRERAYYKNGYNPPQVSNWTWSTTAGDTNIQFNDHDLNTGDWIMIYQCTRYSGSDTFSNRFKVNGIWQVTKVDDDNFKLQGYTAHSTSESGGSKGYFHRINPAIVELPSGLPVQQICCTEENRNPWTPVDSNTTCSDPYHTQSTWGNDWLYMPPGNDYFNVSGSASLGKVAHYQLPTALNLSGYQQVSFMLGWQGGSQRVGADSGEGGSGTTYGTFALKLCSDTAGNTPVNTIVFDMRHHYSTSRWIPCVVDTGAALGSNIQSVALHKLDQNGYTGSQQFHISNVVACKASSAADSITHKSMIGMNTATDKSWYPIQWMHKGLIKLAHQGAFNRRWSISYYGSGDGVLWTGNTRGENTGQTIYKRESQHLFQTCWQQNGQGTISNSQLYGNMNTGGSSTQRRIIVQGGWSGSNMDTHTAGDMTFIDSFIQGYGSIGGNSQSYKFYKDLFLTRLNGEWGDYHSGWANIGMTHCNYCRFTGHWVKCMGLIQASHKDNSQGFASGIQPFSSGLYPDASGKDFNYVLNMSYKYQGEQDEWWSNSNTTGVEWSVINTEAGPSIYGNTNHMFKVHKLIGGNYWRNRSYGVSDSQGFISHIVDLEHDTGFPIYYSGSGNKTIQIDNFTQTEYLPSWATSPSSSFWGGKSDVQYGFYINQPNHTITINGGSSSKRFYIANGSQMNLDGFVLNDTQPHNVQGTLYALNDGGVTGAHKAYIGYGVLIEPETTIRKTASGYAWKATTSSGNSYGKAFTVAKIAVNSGGTVAVKCWMYRTTNNANSYGEIVLKKNTMIGMTQDIVADNSGGSANTWEEITAYVQPTAAGIVEVQLNSVIYDTAVSIYYDDMSLNQA